jgi:hypothetical protein
MTSRTPRPLWRRRGRCAALAAGGLLLLALTAGPASAAGAHGPDRIIFDPTAAPSWTQELHGTGSSWDLADQAVMAAGGVTYVIGTLDRYGSSDGTFMKYANGAPAWAAAKIYNGPNGGPDGFVAVALGPDNTIYTAGYRTAANGLQDIILARWSAAGTRLWLKRYDSPTHSADYPSTMTVDAAGNATVAGVAYDGGSQDWLVISWSPSGAQRWASRLNADAGSAMAPWDLVAAADRDVYVTGMSAVGSTVAAMTVRYSPSGQRKWTKTYSGPSGLNTITWAAAARPGGGVYVCGGTNTPATGEDGIVMSYTKSGDRDVFALDTGPGGLTDQMFNDLDVTSTGQVVAVGSSETAGNEDARVVAFTIDGTVAGQVTFPGAWDDEFKAVAADAFGGYYITGIYHTAVNRTAIVTARGSVIAGGGGFTSLWTPALISENNTPYGIAVRGTTACVVGQCSADAAQGVDQIALWYQY